MYLDIYIYFSLTLFLSHFLSLSLSPFLSLSLSLTHTHTHINTHEGFTRVDGGVAVQTPWLFTSDKFKYHRYYIQLFDH